MAIDTGRAGLWLYRQVHRTGLLSRPLARRAFEAVYGQYKRHLEDPFYHLTRRHPELFAGGHIIDVGANIGYTARVFATAIGQGFRVWAFEPSSENFRHLQDAISDQGLQGMIMAQRAGVGDRVGTMPLILNADHPADHRVGPRDADRPGIGHGDVEDVPITTIDACVRAQAIAPVAFIKVDVQGYEFHVCQGMSATLDANRGIAVVLEYTPDALLRYGVEPAALSQFFAQRGFNAYRVTQRGRLDALDILHLPEHLAAPGYIDILFTRATQAGVQS